MFVLCEWIKFYTGARVGGEGGGGCLSGIFFPHRLAYQREELWFYGIVSIKTSRKFSLGRRWQRKEKLIYTVEPHLTTTPLIRPPRYYDHFFVPNELKAQSFPYFTSQLIRPARYLTKFSRPVGSCRDRRGGGAGRAIATPLFFFGLIFRAPDDMDNVWILPLDSGTVTPNACLSWPDFLTQAWRGVRLKVVVLTGFHSMSFRGYQTESPCLLIHVVLPLSPAK